ncbi:hypothetical protein [Streptomyces luteolifulvus]|uniref:hypothetical protein n=1 Tax=Streptomyces luteolifulvus TaxID=2615112 RepID=UPI001CD9877A|nr:hypothetical protein [Streptomyces luteolifulvus]
MRLIRRSPGQEARLTQPERSSWASPRLAEDAVTPSRRATSPTVTGCGWPSATTPSAAALERAVHLVLPVPAGGTVLAAGGLLLSGVTNWLLRSKPATGEPRVTAAV